jgi:hypothetical protein
VSDANGVKVCCAIPPGLARTRRVPASHIPGLFILTIRGEECRITRIARVAVKVIERAYKVAPITVIAPALLPIDGI